MVKKVYSLTDRIWEISDPRDFSKMSPAELFDIILQNRGVSDAESFRKASLKNLMPDPFFFIDMEKAVARILTAVKLNQRIVILGDYDVDGISSTVLLMKFFEHIGIEFSYSIPNRMEDGYGLNIKNLERYRDHLVITVDCGSNSIDELDYAKENGIDVIVLDHHKMERGVSQSAIAIVNPHRPDEQNTYHYLCAAGVVFMCIVGINRALRNCGFYDEKKITEPKLIDYSDLVALATVCDVMPLIDLNRAFVSAGIKKMTERKNLGINALIDLNEVSEISVETIAFSLGPKINAAGRIDSADIAVKLLSTKDSGEARGFALRLEELNRQRQSIEREIFEEAKAEIEENLNFICVSGKDWHVGVIGIVAGRLKERYHKPTFVVSIDESGKGRASCRSVPGVDISVLIAEAIQRKIIAGGGGHSMAGGFSINADKISAFIEFLKKEVKYTPQREILNADCYLSIEAISFDLLYAVSRAGPFGIGFQYPKFVIPDLKVVSSRIVGKNHVQLCFEGNGKNLKGIAFRCADSKLGQQLLSYDGYVQVLGTLSVSEWNCCKYINLTVEDIAANSTRP